MIRVLRILGGVVLGPVLFVVAVLPSTVAPVRAAILLVAFGYLLGCPAYVAIRWFLRRVRQEEPARRGRWFLGYLWLICLLILVGIPLQANVGSRAPVANAAADTRRDYSLGPAPMERRRMRVRAGIVASRSGTSPWSHWVTISFTAPSHASVATRVSRGRMEPSATASSR